MAQGFTGNAVVQVMPTLTSDAGTATASGNNINVLGGTLIDTAGATDTLTINADSTVIASVASDSGTATGATNAITVTGTGGITTSGSGSTLTIDGSGVSGSGGTVVNMTSTSGTSVTFGSIPSGTKLIILSFINVSITALNVQLRLRIGDSGGLETTGYLGIVSSVTTTSQTTVGYSTYFPLTYIDTGGTISGSVTLTLADESNNSWTMSGVTCFNVPPATNAMVSGSKSLSATLTQLEVYIASSAFDAGSMAITYYS